MTDAIEPSDPSRKPDPPEEEAEASSPDAEKQLGSPLAPVTAGERYESLDVLRGFAVLGILAMNVYAFAMPFAAYTNPLLHGGDGVHLGTWVFTHLVFDQKFMTIFSMLFGAGLVLMHERAEARGRTVVWVYCRRMLWLLAIGAVHGYLIWFGDILASYALCGFLILLLRKLRPRTLIVIGVVALLVPIFVTRGMGAHFEHLKETAAEADAALAAGETLTEEQQAAVDEWTEMRPMMFPGPEEVWEDVEVHRGGYPGIVEQRAPLVFAMQTFMWVAFGVWRMGGLMLLGMAFVKLGILYATRDDRLYVRWIVTGYGLGLPIVAYSAHQLFEHDFDAFYLWDVGVFYNYIGSIFVGLAHVAVVMLAVKRGLFPALRARLAAVGRMALSNYLMHSVLLTTVFYGYGFGLYGHVDRLYQMAFVLVVWLLQLYLSPIWLRHYRFGPAEWLWRSLTYWKRQPMRLAG